MKYSNVWIMNDLYVDKAYPNIPINDGHIAWLKNKTWQV